MKKLNTLNDLLFEQTITLHSNLKYIIEELHFLIERATEPSLKNLLKKHYDTIRIQEQRVQKIFNHFETNYPSGNFEVREMIKNIFCRIGRSGETLVIDAIITMGMKQVSGYMMVSFNIAKDLSENLGRENLKEYINDCLKTEYKFLDRLQEYEHALIS